MASTTIEVQNEAEVALKLACEHLLSLQDEAGWWQGELQTNVTMDAEDMLLREFLGVRERRGDRALGGLDSLPAARRRHVDQLPRRPRRPVDDDRGLLGAAPGRRSARGRAHARSRPRSIRAQGGVERARVFTHLWLALFGLWSWDRVPALPPEVMLLPRWVPLNVYDFACWARQTIVALSLVKAHRPVRAASVRARRAGRRRSRRRAPSARARCAVSRLRSRAVYERHPIRPLRRLAIARAERWIVRRQEADGSWGGIQPPWVYSLIALHLSGYPLEHPVMRRGLEGLDRFMVEDRDDSRGVGRAGRSEPAPGSVPVARLGHGARDRSRSATPACPAIIRRWCAPPTGCSSEEVAAAATGRSRGRGSRPAAGRSSSHNVNYPDVDDTAEVVLALRRVRRDAAAGRGAIERAAGWVQGMQSADGGWGAFDADNTRRARARAAVPGLRRGDRRAERRRDARTPWRCSPRSACSTRRPRSAASAG